MKVGSLFSGIGGLDLGLERAGMEVVWQVEIDPFCQRVLAKHWPNVPRYGDIKELRGEQLEAVDLIAGGFPCQPVSHAGRRLGEADDRFLWPEMLRLIREVRPRFVLGENVFGLVTHDEGALLASIVADLEDAGYEVAPPVVFPAAAVGALHRRDRVWLCAHARHDGGRAEQGIEQEERAEVAHRVRDVRNAASVGLEEPRRLRLASHRETTGDREADPTIDAGWWATEPDVGRVANGVPDRVDRLKALGNAVVPQAAEFLGRRIMEVSR